MPDAFDDILALVRPERLLRDPRATGQGVRLAILDTGVDRGILAEKHPAHHSAIEGGLFRQDRAEPEPSTDQPSAPHGTTVADIILTLAPQVQLYSADVFGSTGACDVETVIRALRYVTESWNAKIVNLSLGVSEARLQAAPRRQALQRAIEDAYYRDVLVFAAAHNDHPLTRSYPAVFAPPLLSVDKGRFTEPMEFAYHLSDQVEFQAFARGYIGPFAGESATSWATPHLAGLTARLLSLRPNLKPFEIKTLLYWMSLKESPKKSDD